MRRARARSPRRAPPSPATRGASRPSRARLSRYGPDCLLGLPGRPSPRSRAHRAAPAAQRARREAAVRHLSGREAAALLRAGPEAVLAYTVVIERADAAEDLAARAALGPDAVVLTGTEPAHAARPLRPFFGQMRVSGSPSASAIRRRKCLEGRSWPFATLLMW